MTMLFLILACQNKGTDSAAEEPMIISGHVLGVVGNPLEGVQVCSEEQCSATDDDGEYQLTVNPGEISLLLDKADHYGGLAALTVLDQGQTVPNLALISSSLFASQMANVGLAETPGTGSIAFSISNGVRGDGINIDGVSVSLDSAGGEGPFYNSTVGMPYPDLTETSINGGGVFVNLAEGEYHLQHQNLPGDCSSLLGWEGPENLVVPVAQDRASYARIECR
jgi:hypothetical protein